MHVNAHSAPAPAVPPVVPFGPAIEYRPAPDAVSLELEELGLYELAGEVRAGLVEGHAVTMF